MTRTKRKILFWIAVFTFLTITPLIVSHARGYRFDLQRREITRVGAILLDSEPDDANIWVNNKKTDKKTRNAIKNLLPFRSYTIKIEKEGFQPWEKQLEVEPEKIIVAKNIILFPEELNFKEFSLDISLENFSVSPDGKKLFGIREDDKLFIKDTSSLSSSTPFFLDGIRTLSIDNISWSQNNERVIFSRQIRGDSFWYILNTGNNELINITQLYEKKLFFFSSAAKPLPRKFNAEKILFLDNKGEQIAVLAAENILVIDTNKELLNYINIEKVESIATKKESIFIFKKPDILLAIDNDGENIIEQENLRFSPQDIVVSPDGKKLAYFHEYTVGMLWLEDSNDEMQRQKGEQDIILQSTHPIKKFFWHSSSNYVMALLENGEFIIGEIDVRGRQNVASWRITNVSQISYSIKDRSLWVLKKDGAILRHLEEF